MTAPPSAPVSAVAGKISLFLPRLSSPLLSLSLTSKKKKKKTPSALTSILRNEGVLALWRGAAPRAIWVAPLGAMNFAGYELAKRALERGGSGGSGSGEESEEASVDGDGGSENNEDERLKEE